MFPEHSTSKNYMTFQIKDLEGGPLGTLSDLITVFTAPQYFIDKRNSKILDYDNLCGEGSLVSPRSYVSD